MIIISFDYFCQSADEYIFMIACRLEGIVYYQFPNQFINECHRIGGIKLEFIYNPLFLIAKGKLK